MLLIVIGTYPVWPREAIVVEDVPVVVEEVPGVVVEDDVPAVVVDVVDAEVVGAVDVVVAPVRESIWLRKYWP